MAKQIIIISVLVSVIWVSSAIARYYIVRERLKRQKAKFRKIWEEFKETIRQ